MKPKPAPKPIMPAPFDVTRAMAHTKKLSVGIGRRVGGTVGEYAAISYARDYLFSPCYAVTVQSVPLSNGRTSHNVVASRPAAVGKPFVVIGGHIDSKGVAPGGDDNATGCGTVLELARDFAKATPAADYRFVLFGTEELIGDGNSDHHHYGSREYVRRLTSAERSRMAAAVIIDMIGYGPDFRVRNMGVGTRALCDRLLAVSRTTGAPLAYLQDPGKPSGWSDHEAFERAGFPAAWLEWRDNPNAHTSGDTYAKLDAGKVKTTGVLVHTWLRSVKLADLEALARF
jgi:Zn-dependent M28 family amino/carboxypeptidase